MKSFGICHEEGTETIDDNEKIPTPLNENDEVIAQIGNKGMSSVVVIQRYHHSIELSIETFRMISFHHTFFCVSLTKIEKISFFKNFLNSFLLVFYDKSIVLLITQSEKWTFKNNFKNFKESSTYLSEK